MTTETKELLKDIAPYFTIITTVVSAVMVYKSNLRLKAFEILVARRDKVLEEVAELAERLQEIRLAPTTESLQQFSATCLHERIVLTQKIRGCNFGSKVEHEAKIYYDIIEELVEKRLVTHGQLEGAITRLLHTLTELYAIAHSEVTTELKSLSTSTADRFCRWWRSILVD